ncbi:TatD family hydrolase [Thermodesulfobacterium hveragerdense]|uniref:TatD family hydrolase n=1 Tax=Thermodesulfobacterium hveragerdense TaxID=53424 RepID=UPI00041457F4|nr:TatD family hydrolase [Thermodesulfobacterium hveragerdense]
MLEFIDSHAHLNLPDFKKDLEDTINRAKQNEVIHCVVVGINPSTNKKALDLHQKYPDFISPALGFHPHEVKKLSEEDYKELVKLLPQAVALGEIGLDWVKEYSPKEMQIEHFERQLEIAKSQQKPVILHLRGEESLWETAITILKNFLPLNFVSHCFTSGPKIAKKILDIGGHISIPGVVTFPKAEDLRNAVKFIPLERILIETDCPYLTPVPFRGKRNEPAFLPYTAQKIAETKGLPLEEVAEKVKENTIRFFSLVL